MAFQANPLGCDEVESVHVSAPRRSELRLAVRTHSVCGGGGAAAKGTAVLIAVPLRALPRSGTLSVRVELAMRPGDQLALLGRASTPL